MKPHDRKPNKRASEAAVRTQLRAKLGWLQGFPTGEATGGGVPWLVVPQLRSRAEVRELRVDRELLRASSYARNSILRRFPHALPRVVGQVDAWAAQVSARLDLLKASVHDGAPLPGFGELLEAGGFRRGTAKHAQATWEQLPRVRVLLAARAWLGWGDDVAFGAALEELEAHSSRLAVLLGQGAWLRASKALARLGVPEGLRGQVLALRWCDWLAEGAPGELLQLLADPRCWTVPTRSGGFLDLLLSELKQRQSGHDLDMQIVEHGFPRPPERLAPELVEVLLALPARNPKRRDRVLQLAGLLYGPEQLDAWEAWWGEASEAERRTRKLLAQREAVRGDLKDLAAELRKQTPKPPVEVTWQRGAQSVQDASEHATDAEFAGLVSVLEALPASAAGRAARAPLARSWGYELGEAGRRPKVVARLLAGQAALVRAVPAPSEVQLEWLSSGLSGELQGTWTDEPTPLKVFDVVLVALEALVRGATQWEKRHGPFRDFMGWDVLVEVARVTGDPERARELYTALRERVEFWRLDSEAWRLILQLGRADPERCAKLAPAWQAAGLGPGVPELERLIQDPDLAQLLSGALAEGEGARIRRLVGWSQLLGSLNPPERRAAWRAPLLKGDPDWSRYPAALRPGLDALAGHEPDAEATVARVLGKDFPDPRRLEGELAALRERVAEAEGRRRAGLVGRIAGLEARLERPRTVSPARLATCAAKLERRARLAQLGRCEARLRERLVAALSLRSEAVPGAWLEDSETLAVISALGGLQPASRTLGFRLLRERVGAPPWDLRDAPANRAFLDRLQAQGHDPQAWLDGLGPRSIALPDGVTWTLDLEPDPLQVLRMGQPFNTCLAPGAFNFFSAVSNAADVNKRVLYARDKAGTIRGRCLIALTRDGGLLAFRVYGHERHDELTEAVRGYVSELAGAVGVRLVARGYVEALVAKEWYDDGPVDLTGRLAFLEGGSDFMERLPGLEPDELFGALREANGGEPATASLVYALLQRGVLASRPQLIVPLLPLLPRGAGAVDPWTRLQVVRLLIQAEQREGALRFLAPLTHRTRIDGDEWNQSQGFSQAAECYTDLGLPQRALRLLLRTRPPRVRGWKDDYSHRLLAGARATRALRRPRKALELYRYARDEGADGAKQAIDELEAELAGGR